MRIRRRGSARTDPPVRVAVIGGGFGGIAAAVALRKAGFDDFVVFERSMGLGGTWLHNHYPGAQTDAASHVYCYSFARYDWSRTHVGDRELREYLEHVVDRFDVRRFFRFGHGVESVVWDDQAQEYELTEIDGQVHRFHAVISAVGFLNVPRLPELPGLTSFSGTRVHTATWDDSLDPTGRRVAVMGTGSSATQVITELAGRAEKVLVFQRQPGWVLPKGDRDFAPWERRLWSLPALWRFNRLRLYLRQERREFRGAVFIPGSKVNLRMRTLALDTIAATFSDRPDLAAALTPSYPFGGKRAVLSSGYFETLLRENVELVPHSVVSCTPRGVVDATGTEREVDVLVTATGFEAANYLLTIKVVGREHTDLHEFWAGEPFAFLGITVPKFPNFFMLYGPNTNGGFIVPNLERQAAYAVKEIRRLRRPAVGAVEVRADITGRFNTWLQRKISRTAFATTENYFQTASGKVVTQWPESATLYAILTVLLRRVSTMGNRAPRRTGQRVSAGAPMPPAR